MTVPLREPAKGAPREWIGGWLKEFPTLGVVSRGVAPAALVPLLGLVRRWSRIVVLTADVREPVDAVLVCSPDLIGQHGGPSAVWVETLSDLASPEVSAATVVLSNRDDVMAHVGARGLLVTNAAEAPGVAAAVPVAPFVRRRLRAARNIGGTLIIEHDGEGWKLPATGEVISPELAPTAIACASAAVVRGPALLEAMAWATPCITDAETQAMVGADAGRHVLVGQTTPERRLLAGSVATNDQLASRLSWLGRQLIEVKHRPGLTAAHLVRRLGLGAAAPLPGPAPLAASLADLGTPVGAAVAQRVRLATTALRSARD